MAKTTLSDISSVKRITGAKGGGYRYGAKLKSGQFRFIDEELYNKFKGTKTAKTGRVSGSKRQASPKRKRRMPKKKKGGKKRTWTLPILPVVGIGLLFTTPMGDSPLDYIRSGDIRSLFIRLAKSLTGYDANVGRFVWGNLNVGAAMLFAFLAHKIASTLGINRILGQTFRKVPLLEHIRL